jgi:hypothetical protein
MGLLKFLLLMGVILLKKQVEQGRRGLKTLNGYYEYSNGYDKSLKRERNQKFYDRLCLLRNEQTQTGAAH